LEPALGGSELRQVEILNRLLFFHANPPS